MRVQFERQDRSYGTGLMSRESSFWTMALRRTCMLSYSVIMSLQTSAKRFTILV